MQRSLTDNNQGKSPVKLDIVKLLVGIAAGIFVVSLGISLWIFRPSEANVVEIVSDGEILYTIDLSEAENQELVISYHDSSNTVKIENGDIRVQEAECPDRTCVKMGKLSSESLPIVCLPNRLIIRYAE